MCSDPSLLMPFSPEEVAGMIGEGARKLVQSALEKCRLEGPVAPTCRALAERYSERLTDCTTLYPDVPEALAGLAGYRMALVSNKTEQLAEGYWIYSGSTRYLI